MPEIELPEIPDHLSTEQVAEFEQSLLEQPDDLTARTQLLTHYMMAAFRSKEAREAHLRHVLWVVQHHPESDLAGTPFVLLHQSPPKVLKQVRTLWAQQVARFPEDARVWGHGAKFLLFSPYRNEPQTREWLQTAERLDPTNPAWPQQLGLIADFERRQEEGQKRREAARRALPHYERAYALTVDTESRILLLDSLAQNALAIGELSKAQEYATQLLNSALQNPDGERDWNHGNALHWSHIVLGQIALQQGEREAAREHLHAAGQTPGSPQLNSFGPNISLARELLEQGEKAAVIAYFEDCSRFWVMGKAHLEEWLAAVRQDRTPDFNDACRR